MKRWTGRACALILVLATVSRADVAASGVYLMSESGPGQRMARADADGEVVIGKQVSARLSGAALVSCSNDNSTFQLSLTAGPIGEEAAQQRLAVVVGGLCMPVWSQSDRKADGSISLGTTVASREAAGRIAAELGIKPRLRVHPGHQLAISFRPTRKTYRSGEAVTLVMTIRNVGKTIVRFYDGGSQRGPRNNQFGFTAFYNRGYGPALPDIGDPQNFGGLAAYKTLGPSEVFEKEVDLSKWFEFDSVDTYKVTGMYQLTLCGGDWSEVLWDDFAVGTCQVRVVATNEKSGG